MIEVGNFGEFVKGIGDEDVGKSGLEKYWLQKFGRLDEERRSMAVYSSSSSSSSGSSTNISSSFSSGSESSQRPE